MAERTRSFLALLGLLDVVAGLAVRAYIHHGLTLPSVDPVRFFVIGMAQDVLVFAGVAIALSLWVPDRIAQTIAAMFVIVTIALHALSAEGLAQVGSEGLRFVADSLHALWVAIPAAVLVVAAAAFLAPRVTIRTPRKRVAILIACAVMLVTVPVPLHRFETTRNPWIEIYRIAATPGRAEPEEALHGPKPPMPLAEIATLIPNDGRRPLSRDYPLAHVAPPSPLRVNGKPNIVLLMLESLRAEEVNAHGGIVPGVTPHFDALAKKGIFFKNAFSTGSQTPQAEMALLYGILPITDKILLSARPRVPLTGLPELLRARGWRSVLWISSTDETFYYRDAFYLPRHVNYVDGTFFPASDPHVNWGASDRALMRRAIEAINRLEPPFLSVVLTVNNHHAYDLPSDTASTVKNLPPIHRTGTNTHVPGRIPHLLAAMLQTIHYTDRALADFFAYAEQQPWYANTIFVITGDHGNGMPTMRNPPGNRTLHEIARLRHHVPLVIYSPLLEGGKVVDAPVSHADVPPTLLSLLGIDERAGTGTNILNTIHPDRAVVCYSRHEDLMTIVTRDRMWHGVIRASSGGRIRDEVLIDRTTAREMNLAAQGGPQLARFRRMARAFVDLHRWVVLDGRSGLPPG